ncbi:MAG TPA: hypothetical protein VFV96_10010 [Verrucomicrobiae bacterium]|nr:hypothetical protein [Verrucomicrobiae bacterium]
MNPLAARRQLLIAESELNRAGLADDMTTLTVGVRTLIARAKSFGSLASAAAVLVAGVTAFRRGKSRNAEAKPSWLPKILKGTGLVSTLWQAFRRQGGNQPE